MAAEQRKLLEQLMGADALDPRGIKRQEIDLYDPKICKSFLVGTCPHDLFTHTKQDLGPCPKLHLEQHKMEYESQKAQGVDLSELDFEYEKDLEKYIFDCDRRIDVAIQRLERTPEDIAKLNDLTKSLETIDANISLAVEEIELLGQKEEIPKALYEYSKLQTLKQDKEAKEREIRGLSEISGFSGHQKLQVCDACGAYLSRMDNDRRLADHFIGRMHIGYRQMRRAYEEIKKKNESKPRTRGHRTGDREREKGDRWKRF